MTNSGVPMKVLEAHNRDVGKGIARIDPLVMQHMSMSGGDTIQIKGKKVTVARAWNDGAESKGEGGIRLDGETRRNARVSIDERVYIQRVKGHQAKKVTLALREEMKIIGLDETLGPILKGRAVTRGDVLITPVIAKKVDLVVISTVPNKECVIIDGKTNINISSKPLKEGEKLLSRISYDDIGGLDDEIKKLREMIEMPLRHPEVFDRLGIDPPKGLLLHGPPGTGKTLLARAVASETQSNFFNISGPEMMSKFHGQSEENLRNLFKTASEKAPSIIFIDEIDSIAPKRDEVVNEVEKRMVSQLLALMDGIEKRRKVVVIGATNRPNSIDPALRRPGRFDRELDIGIPNREARLEILEIHARGMPLGEDVVLEEIADISHGYVGADLEALCKESAMHALRRTFPSGITGEDLPENLLKQLKVEQRDFLQAFRELQPSALREVLIEKPNVSWDDIGGLEEIKETLKEIVEWPFRYKKLYSHMKGDIPSGIMLHGPPGTGKTLLAKAVASESQANFINVKGPEFLSKWVGESEKAVRETFRKAKVAAPCIIFFDEIDALVPTRGAGAGSAMVTERVISQLLTEMDGLEQLHDVITIGATNRPDLIDKALLRPGRFDRIIEVPLPDQEARKEIFRIHLREKPVQEGISLGRAASLSEGLSGAEIRAACQEAVMGAIRRHIREGKRDSEEEVSGSLITLKDLESSISAVKNRDEKIGVSPERTDYIA